MVIEEFVKSVKKVNAGEDLPLEYVQNSFNNIAKEEIKTCRNYFNCDNLK